MCLCARIITVLSIVWVSRHVQCAPSSSWPPKMKNYDIWGTSSTASHLQEQHNTSNINDINQPEHITNDTSFRGSRGKNIFLNILVFTIVSVFMLHLHINTFCF